MISKSVYKVPNGKLLKITLDYNELNKTINNVKITGDFFAYPEGAIEIIENELINIELEKGLLLKKITGIINDGNIDFIGLDAEGLVNGILMCLK
jgi:hypothetical protein